MKHYVTIMMAASIAFLMPLQAGHKKHSHSSHSSSEHEAYFHAFTGHNLLITSKKSHGSKKHTVAINPSTKQPYVFWFVSNLASNVGDGTFEYPFNKLSAAQAASSPYDVIYVYSGDLSDNGMDEGIILKRGQCLFGAGMTQHLQTTLGKVAIPKHSPEFPTISDTNVDQNVALAAVTLSEGENTVSGLNLHDTIGVFVFNCPPDALNSSGALNIYGGKGYNIKNNYLYVSPVPNTLNSGNAMNVFGGGNMKIHNNRFIALSGDIDMWGLLMLNGFCISTPFEGEFEIFDNKFTGETPSDGFAQGLHIDAFHQIGKVTMTIKGNHFNSFSNTTTFDPIAGIDIFAGPAVGQSITFNIEDNTVRLPANAAQDNVLGCISVTGFGPGTTYTNIRDNDARNDYGVTDYILNDNGNPNFLQFKAENRLKN